MIQAFRSPLLTGAILAVAAALLVYGIAFSKIEAVIASIAISCLTLLAMQAGQLAVLVRR
jgi:hypothetical protein